MGDGNDNRASLRYSCSCVCDVVVCGGRTCRMMVLLMVVVVVGWLEQVEAVDDEAGQRYMVPSCTTHTDVISTLRKECRDPLRQTSALLAVRDALKGFHVHALKLHHINARRKLSHPLQTHGLFAGHIKNVYTLREDAAIKRLHAVFDRELSKPCHVVHSCIAMLGTNGIL